MRFNTKSDIDRTHYTVYKSTARHNYSGSYLKLSDLYLEYLKNSNIKIFSAKKQDITKKILGRLKAAHDRRVLMEKKEKQKKLLGLRNGKKDVEIAPGYYCSCIIKDHYKDPKDVPKDIAPITYDRTSHSAVVPIDSNKACLFCGYYATYSHFAMKGNKTGLGHITFIKEPARPPEWEKRAYEKKKAKEKKNKKGKKADNILDAVRNSLAGTRVDTGADDRLPRCSKV